jgi:hypothetical protein
MSDFVPGSPGPTALLADDEPHLVAHLAQRLAVQWPELALVATCGNGL